MPNRERLQNVMVLGKNAVVSAIAVSKTIMDFGLEYVPPVELEPVEPKEPSREAETGIIVPEDDESAVPAPPIARKKMPLLDHVGYYTFIDFVPAKWQEQFKPFEACIAPTEPPEKDAPVDVDVPEFSAETAADIQLATGIAYIQLDQLLRI